MQNGELITKIGHINVIECKLLNIKLYKWGTGWGNHVLSCQSTFQEKIFLTQTKAGIKDIRQAVVTKCVYGLSGSYDIIKIDYRIVVSLIINAVYLHLIPYLHLMSSYFLIPAFLILPHFCFPLYFVKNFICHTFC